MRNFASRASSIRRACTEADGFVTLGKALGILFDNGLEQVEILARLERPCGCLYCVRPLTEDTEILFAQDGIGNVSIAHVADQDAVHEKGLKTISVLDWWHVKSLITGLRAVNQHAREEAVA